MTTVLAALLVLSIVGGGFLVVRILKLFSQRSFLQSVIDSSSMVSIIATDRDGLITLFNPGAELMLGYTSEEMVGKQSAVLLHAPEEVESRSRSLSAEYGRPVELFELFTFNGREEGHERQEWTYIRKGGSRITVSLAVTVVRNRKGRITGMLGLAKDISERKQAEADLAREKALIEAVFNSVPGMLYLYDMEGNLVRWNRRHETMTGYSSEELSHMRLMDWYKDDEKSQQAVLEGLKATLETGFGDAEAMLQRKDHTSIPMYFTASPITLYDKQYFVGLGIDISARKQADQLIETRLKLIDLSSTLSLEDLLRKTLDEAEILSGSRISFYHFVDEDQTSLSLQAWSTRTLEEFCKVDGHGMHYPMDKAGVWVDCVRTGKPVIHNDYASLPNRKGLPSGHAPVLRELTVPVIKNGKVAAILGVGNKESPYTQEDVRVISFLADVTWEIVSGKRVSEALRESESKLQALFTSMAEMVALHELVFDEGGKAVNYRIVDCNEAFTGITGMPRESVRGRLATEVYGTEEPPYLEEFSRVALTGSMYRYETYFPPMDKHFSISVVSPSKNTFATITTDITESKRIQAVIDAKNKELEQIVYVASHDLRSPLVNVDGYSRELDYSLKDIRELLGAGAAPGDLERKLLAELPDMDKSISRIRTSAAQMDKLLKGLLRLSRQGRASLQFDDIDMNRCIAQLADSLSFTLTERKAALTAEDLPPCRGDLVQLTQVFTNLIVNAIHYSDPSRKPEIRITGSSGTDKVVYRVQDNGIGIAENHLEHVFELFHRLNPDKTEGEGIGLTIVRQALSRMYGDIRVESELGKGSTFIVTLPRARSRPDSGRNGE